MRKRDEANLIRNIYDDSTIDTLRALDQNILTLMSHNPEYAHIEIHYYERVPVKAGTPQSHIRVDISKNGKAGHFFLTEEFINRLEESDDIRKELVNVMKKIKIALME